MSETTIGIIVSAILLGILIITAALLDRRSKNKGDILTGKKYKQKPGSRLSFYLSLLGLLVFVAIFVWGFYINSKLIMILGAIIILAGIGFSYYSRIRNLEDMIAERKKYLDGQNRSD